MSVDLDVSAFRVTSEMLSERPIIQKKTRKRRLHWVRLPMAWYERLEGAPGQTYRVALYLLYLHWKGNGKPIKLANGMLKMDGVPPESRRRALRDLERRGVISVERRPRKSPIITLWAAPETPDR